MEIILVCTWRLLPRSGTREQSGAELLWSYDPMNSINEITMTLDKLVDQQSCSVLAIRGDENQERIHRLLTLGIFPGVKLQLLRRAPLGDPMQLKVGQSLVSLRSADASVVEIGLTHEFYTSSPEVPG